MFMYPVFLGHLVKTLPCIVPGGNSESGHALSRHSDYVLKSLVSFDWILLQMNFFEWTVFVYCP